MENKNFEKKELFTKKNGITPDKFNLGYNTCLDRTNAKGIYEAAIEFINAMGKKTELSDLVKLKNKLKTELNKIKD